MIAEGEVLAAIASVDADGAGLDAWNNRHAALPQSFAASQPADDASRDTRRLAHLLLRWLLVECAGLDVPAGGIELRPDELGRPSLTESRLAVNLSHSGRFGLAAVSAAGSIGVDVEDLDRTRLPRGRFRDRIVAAGAGLAGRVAVAADGTEGGDVLAAWVAIEAHAKARGGGIWSALAATGVHGREIASDSIETAAHELAVREGLTVRLIDTGSLPCRAALACSSSARLLPLRRFVSPARAAQG